MSILTQARTDWERFSQSVFDLDVIFNAGFEPSSETATIKCMATEIAVALDLDGQDAIGDKVRVTFSENLLKTTNPSYPIRNAKNLVEINNHLVTFPDSNGTVRTYAIKNVYPDSTVGMITCDCAVYMTHPKAPEDLVVSSLATTSFTGTITSNSNSIETGFQWEISTDNFVSDITVAGTTLTNVLTFNYTGLTTATTYYVRAKATGGKDSEYTETETVTTL